MVNAGPDLSVGGCGGSVTVCAGALRPAFRCRTTLGIVMAGSAGGWACGDGTAGAVGMTGPVGTLGAAGGVGVIGAAGAAAGRLAVWLDVDGPDANSSDTAPSAAGRLAADWVAGEAGVAVIPAAGTTASKPSKIFAQLTQRI